MSRTLLIGCGYVGRPLAQQLQRAGHHVTAWVHSEATAAALAEDCYEKIITGSVADPAKWREVSPDTNLIFHCASSGRGGIPAYEEVFLQGMRQVAQHLPSARTLLVSSTSVYGQNDGELVDENSPAEPSSPTSRVLRQAEIEALARGAIVVRSAGIYGPGRAHLLEKMRRGEAVIEGDGTRWMNQIHQRDLVAAIQHLAMGAAAPGETYNATDDEPVQQRDYYAWCADHFHLPLPKTGPVDPNRKRGLTNKRISNARLRSTGWQASHPTFREGLTADPR